jgi:nucleotide-binding universal stress UspA family protein
MFEREIGKGSVSTETSMFEKVLVSMDLSPATEALVSALPSVLELGTREITIVHVAKPTRGSTSESLTKLEEVRGRLNGLADQLREVGFEVSVRVPTGAPIPGVIKAVEAKDPDVVMVGSRSHTLISEAFIGSVAWDIVRNVGRPVLLQRIEPNRGDPEAALKSPGSGVPKHVVFPADFSDTAKRARPWLLGLAKENGPSFSLLHVLSSVSDEGRKQAESQLEDLADELRGRGATDVGYRVPIGTPYEEILNAGGNRADALVVMGTHGRGLLPGVVLGSVGRQMVRHASARVLLLPGDEVED